MMQAIHIIIGLGVTLLSFHAAIESRETFAIARWWPTEEWRQTVRRFADAMLAISVFGMAWGIGLVVKELI